ncbi:MULTISPECIES: hypothetical protein [Halomonas]|uniref:hypothetical protein n=1 Tax=Halomonas TaxID=2745 RepID=UPI001866F404|nr:MULTISPECIES: hypothetical protein [Halomonas]
MAKRNDRRSLMIGRRLNISVAADLSPEINKGEKHRKLHVQRDQRLRMLNNRIGEVDNENCHLV